MKSNTSINECGFPLGSIEPHAGLLNIPNNNQFIYKIMRLDDLMKSISESYFHFTRIDRYKDFLGADLNDGKQSPKDLQKNERIKFIKENPTHTISDYYNKSRRRTYACCFSIEDSEYIWINYGNGASKGKVCLTFSFGKLRFMLNEIIKNEKGVLYNGIPCHQIFSINYGLVEYVNWKNHISSKPPNPIIYTYQKDKEQFEEEKELRISLSAIGVGKFVLNNGQELNFPRFLKVNFNFREAIANGTIKQFSCYKDCNSDYLFSELKKFGINPIN